MGWSIGVSLVLSVEVSVLSNMCVPFIEGIVLYG